MSNNGKIYCLSGLGTDRQIFSALQIQDHTLKYIPWISHLKGESLRRYALRLAEPFRNELPVLLGVSFGGMVAVEMARHIPVKKIIIISGVKTDNELPQWMRLAGKYRLNKFLPVSSNKLTRRFDNRQLGVITKEEAALVQAYRKSTDPSYMDWAINEILNWKNNWYPDNTIHIHGDKDRMFPMKRIRPTHVIKGGTHIMIINRGREISDCINMCLHSL